jgi:hypothetical protein
LPEGELEGAEAPEAAGLLGVAPELEGAAETDGPEDAAGKLDGGALEAAGGVGRAA